MTFCLLLLPLWESVIVLCFVVCYFMSVLVLQSSWWGRESWLLCLICFSGVSWWLSGSSSRCQGVFCSLWLWYFLIILTYYFWWLGLKNFDSRIGNDAGPHTDTWLCQDCACVVCSWIPLLVISRELHRHNTPTRLVFLPPLFLDVSSWGRFSFIYLFIFSPFPSLI